MDLSIGRFAARIPLRPRCSKDDHRSKNDEGDRLSTDWDKAWSSFRKKGKKSLFSQFNPEKYVSRNPRRAEYPLSEEVDPIKRAERSNLMLWTSPKFTLVGAIILVLVLLIYTLSAPLKFVGPVVLDECNNVGSLSDSEVTLTLKFHDSAIIYSV